MNQIAHSAKLYLKHSANFHAIFGMPLSQFWPDHVLGFDSIKFDRLVAKAGKRSMLAIVRDKWGDEAGELLMALASSPVPE